MPYHSARARVDNDYVAIVIICTVWTMHDNLAL